MSAEMFKDAILTVELPDDGLCAGDIGTVVERHDVPGLKTGYSVEFFDLTGRKVAVVTLPASQLRAPTPARSPKATSRDRG